MSGTHPAVTDADAVDDFDWFEDHSGRSYRLRPGYEGWWIVERRPGGELLRTWTGSRHRTGAGFTLSGHIRNLELPLTTQPISV
jgi:hypothetical protein